MVHHGTGWVTGTLQGKGQGRPVTAGPSRGGGRAVQWWQGPPGKGAGPSSDGRALHGTVIG